MTKRPLLTAAGLLLAALAGCDGTRADVDYGKAGLVDVSGAVTMDGKPLPNAVITFEAPDGQFSFAQTDPDGRYTLQFDSQMEGVTPGEKTVRISTRKILGLNTEKEEGDGTSPAGAAEELVPARYNKESELKRAVESDEAQTFDFALESSGPAGRT